MACEEGRGYLQSIRGQEAAGPPWLRSVAIGVLYPSGSARQLVGPRPEATAARGTEWKGRKCFVHEI